ncbi:RHS repeat domain-containing protein [Flammeovirga sp. OC4]|uniref:RHS repeat domain-containing protein n=1 Tax=Flammeovirga sp. OC4 TaxID=1382345 RepID=UPI0005C6E5B4|nr:RHS repeat-associated core domain-containing protein [Flammeovirga sp. OC4]
MGIIRNEQLSEIPIYGSSRLGQNQANEKEDLFAIRSGQRRYEFSNHLGNVLVPLNDAGNVLSYSDYYPFGLTMEDRSWGGVEGGKKYRYGFNGKENDTDLSSSQLIQDYGFRVYNPVIGKFLSVDPLTRSYPWNSTYAFAESRPIDGVDLDGAEFLFTPDGKYIGKYGDETTIGIVRNDMAKKYSYDAKTIGEVNEQLTSLGLNIIFIPENHEKIKKTFNSKTIGTGYQEFIRIGQALIPVEKASGREYIKYGINEGTGESYIESKILRKWNYKGGDYIPSTIDNVDEDNSEIITTITYQGRTSSDLESPINKVIPSLISLLEKSIELANEGGMCINSIEISCTTNGDHSISVGTPNWWFASSSHYEKNGARAADITRINGLHHSKDAKNGYKVFKEFRKYVKEAGGNTYGLFKKHSHLHINSKK